MFNLPNIKNYPTETKHIYLIFCMFGVANAVPEGCAEGPAPCLIGEFSAIRSIAARKIP